MGFLFDKVNKIITVEAPTTEITIQQLINAIRDWEDELENFDVPKVADASGKDDLGGGLTVGITLRLLNWKLKFEDRAGPDYVDCVVKGGNLVAVDANNQPMNPIEPASYVTVTITQSVSAALLAEWTQTQIDTHITEQGQIKTKTDIIPSDLPEVPTMTELDTAHGGGSWEGATPTQVWEHTTRTLSSRDIPEVPGEEIANEDTLGEIKGPDWTDESLKKIKDLIDELSSKIEKVKVAPSFPV